MNQSKLSADPTALVLGIVAIILGFTGCCCYGILAIIPLIISIIGLVSANKSLEEYRSNPEAYSSQSKSNVYTGKILNIIALVFSGVEVLIFIGALIFYGTVLSSSALDEFRNFDNYENEPIFEFEDDSLYDNFQYHERDEVIDTLKSESLRGAFIEDSDI